MKYVLIIFILVFGSQLLVAQQIDTAKLDQYFETLEVGNKLMGNVTLSHNDKVIYQKAIGYADVEKGIKATSESKYRVGSISKMFTAVLTLKAIEENRIDLDRPIDRFFPEIKNASNISIGQLMNHRSGIHSFTSNPDYLAWNEQAKSKEELLKIINDGGSDFDPGTKAEYSNSNYVLLTWILEEIYRQDYAHLVKQYITDPLNLQDTYVGQSISIEDKEVNSYIYLGEWKKSGETHMSIPLGAGAIVSSTADLVKFIEGLFGGKLISENSLELMKEMQDNFGRGMFKFPYYDKFSYGHTGGIDEFKSMLSYFPKEKLTLSLCVNAATMDPNQVAITVLDAFYGKEFEIPVFKDVSLSSMELDQYLGIYSSPNFPLKITITKDNLVLNAQATGQPSFSLNYEGDHIFSFYPARLTMVFDPDKNEMTLKQGGGEFVLKRTSSEN
jgi:D-alanyl-D-alanine carboxypeptidase